jgi:cytochrome c peroxidase
MPSSSSAAVAQRRRTPPYFHDGSVAELRRCGAHHGQAANSAATWVDADIADIKAFLAKPDGRSAGAVCRRAIAAVAAYKY